LSSQIIEGLEAAIVVPILTTHLQWAITDMFGNPIDTQEVVDKCCLAISIASRSVEPLQSGQENKFPTYGDWAEYQGITKGKVGGVAR
jgi:hypothetical protein